MRKLPTVDEVIAFIDSQPNRRHGHRSVSENFLGRQVNFTPESAGQRRLYHRMEERIVNARHRIERRDKSGRFARQAGQAGHFRVYAWAPKEDGDRGSQT
ncbi:MAG: hypothetical protein LVQ64_00300 [Thermoplasmatales archaeon]|nr:hypothetical protein [Thermoplasmatales archaeon]